MKWMNKVDQNSYVCPDFNSDSGTEKNQTKFTCLNPLLSIISASADILFLKMFLE